MTVSNIIDQYLDHLKRQDIVASKRGVAEEVIRGIGEYFNVSLGSQLLYNIEKLQYKEVTNIGCQVIQSLQLIQIIYITMDVQV